MSGLPSIGARPDSISDLVYDAIREAIVNKTLAPGSVVTEAKLAKELSVSKTPVREALLRLRELGLVKEHETRGLRVVQPSRQDIEHAYEVRCALESYAGQLAAARVTTDEKERLREAAHMSVDRADARDAEGFRTWDRTFHQVIADATHNPRLSELVRNAYLVTHVLRVRDVPVSGDSAKCAREHIEIAGAVEAGEADRAAELVRDHIQHVAMNVLNAFAASVGDAAGPGAGAGRL